MRKELLQEGDQGLKLRGADRGDSARAWCWVKYGREGGKDCWDPDFWITSGSCQFPEATPPPPTPLAPTPPSQPCPTRRGVSSSCALWLGYVLQGWGSGGCLCSPAFVPLPTWPNF